VTSGHVQEKVAADGFVASTVVTVVNGNMSKLSPVMSWISMVFHKPEESTVQAMGHGVPAL